MIGLVRAAVEVLGWVEPAAGWGMVSHAGQALLEGTLPRWAAAPGRPGPGGVLGAAGVVVVGHRSACLLGTAFALTRGGRRP